MKQGMEFAEYIDIADKLDEKDYYYTDTHWNQIYITDVAQTLAENMGVKLDDNYETITADTPFYGVYYGPAALPVEPDKMQYLTNDDIKNSIVYDWQNNREIEIYNESMLNTRSPYDLFLGGSISLITIENKVASTDKELVVFRDSFGSSIVPLLISGYKKITLVDIRYLTSNRISDFIEFENQDVLFMYSTLVLNNSSPLK